MGEIREDSEIDEIVETDQVDGVENNEEWLNIVDIPVKEDSITLDKEDALDDIPRMRTLNEKLEGDIHPETGVPYECKKIVDKDGNTIEGVFPQFESELDISLPEDLCEATFDEQKEYLNGALQDVCDEEFGEPKIRDNFTEEELEDISYGLMPEGYVWHHNEEKGIMQLVDVEIHDKTAHTGGMSIWGCGHH